VATSPQNREIERRPGGTAEAVWKRLTGLQWGVFIRDREEQVFLVLTLVIVVDERGLLGMVKRSDLEMAAQDGETEESVEELLQRGEFPHLHTDHSLSTALDRMGSAAIDVLPVVSRANVRELEGITTLQDALEHYGVGIGE